MDEFDFQERDFNEWINASQFHVVGGDEDDELARMATQPFRVLQIDDLPTTETFYDDNIPTEAEEEKADPAPRSIPGKVREQMAGLVEKLLASNPSLTNLNVFNFLATTLPIVGEASAKWKDKTKEGYITRLRRPFKPRRKPAVRSAHRNRSNAEILAFARKIQSANVAANRKMHFSEWTSVICRSAVSPDTLKRRLGTLHEQVQTGKSTLISLADLDMLVSDLGGPWKSMKEWQHIVV